ncbi:hypothetical protein VFPPC_16582 [Pochonia chlamydosporia 170]|uniref:Uncharacterized protein n=1 Tax=Pochonia chlamydosporia 170 TaxID=1380566 RepID=A0A179F976_METCM|nr:hypothetical protein VFPPC_16582 [Pochonia chlamydosporia 170]OAQ61947.1 hypothetical protein VFPPC_16582 [Pochonia chlamydosporia 170]
MWASTSNKGMDILEHACWTTGLVSTKSTSQLGSDPIHHTHCKGVWTTQYKYQTITEVSDMDMMSAKYSVLVKMCRVARGESRPIHVVSTLNMVGDQKKRSVQASILKRVQCFLYEPAVNVLPLKETDCCFLILTHTLSAPTYHSAPGTSSSLKCLVQDPRSRPVSALRCTCVCVRPCLAVAPSVFVMATTHGWSLSVTCQTFLDVFGPERDERCISWPRHKVQNRCWQQSLDAPQVIAGK